MADVVYIMKYSCEMIEFNDKQEDNADVNCDGQINTTDAVVVMKYNIGMCESLPYIIQPIFQNYSFPQSNERINYNRSKTLRGEIKTSAPLKQVSVVITNLYTGEDEVVECVNFDLDDCVRFYDTSRSTPSIDSKVKFASLSTGQKKIKLMCSTATEENTVLYERTFNVGFSYSEVADHVYYGSSKSPENARNVLKLLNSLDYNDDGAKIIACSMKYAGEVYSKLDCSRFVQTTIRKSLNIDLPRISCDQAVYCTENGYNVPYENRKTGDLMFTSNLECNCGRYHEIHHSSIYIGKINNIEYIIESTSSLNGVVIRQLWGNDGGNWLIDTVARIAK